MSTKNEEYGMLVDRKILITAMLTGGIFGLLLMAVLVFSFDQPKPEWGSLWRLRPMIFTALATAFGGAFFYLVYRYFAMHNWSRVLAFLIGAVGFIISLWMGAILGLDGTLWD